MTTFLFKMTVVTRMKTPARPLITLNTYCWTMLAGKRPRRNPETETVVIRVIEKNLGQAHWRELRCSGVQIEVAERTPLS